MNFSVKAVKLPVNTMKFPAKQMEGDVLPLILPCSKRFVQAKRAAPIARYSPLIMDMACHILEQSTAQFYKITIPFVPSISLSRPLSLISRLPDMRRSEECPGLSSSAHR